MIRSPSGRPLGNDNQAETAPKFAYEKGLAPQILVIGPRPPPFHTAITDLPFLGWRGLKNLNNAEQVEWG